MKHNKTLALLISCFVLLFTLSACDPTVSDANSDRPGQNYEDPQPTSDGLSDDELFVMEAVGQHDNFVYYRDTITDVIYIRYKESTYISNGYGLGAGLTVMLDPETGLPLTYTRYMEMANQKTP